ncbi:thiazole tautomerase TenI [Bacillus songklensis]|uniref:Thiazole tautomerase TenI n=1 Tax=Bacillus songklensis TaxID=1069116 RepID=A0ABV8B0R8_9BACI
MKKSFAFHAISTGKQSQEELVKVIAAIHRHVDVIHLREKTKTASELVQIMERLQLYDVPLSKIIVNDRVDVAYAMGALGVQLAYHSLPVQQVKSRFPSLLVGKSVHSVGEARLAEKQGADYVLYGHIYSSQSKAGQTPRGIPALQEVITAVSIPVVAIGGIRPEHMQQLKQTGVSGIAVMSGVFLSDDPPEAVKRYQFFLQNGDELCEGTC